MRRHARRALAAQHDQPLASAGRNVHSDEVFDLPGWDGEPEGSSVALDFTASQRLRTSF
jgi:hypothetical protein